MTWHYCAVIARTQLPLAKMKSLRLEMHTGHKEELRATHGSTFIYAWWFFLSSYIVPATSFWLIFQVGLNFWL